ncbi:hypothetical protein BZA70DRAFT_297631 [Myxozyma melibiosi]|uniref:Uncharacterized protein n=1 Tax=Myxozyma melibiosi TaxID=54550 RepID=A0ABR1EYU6_9ASCO
MLLRVPSTIAHRIRRTRNRSPHRRAPRRPREATDAAPPAMSTNTANSTINGKSTSTNFILTGCSFTPAGPTRVCYPTRSTLRTTISPLVSTTGNNKDQLGNGLTARIESGFLFLTAYDRALFIEIFNRWLSRLRCHSSQPVSPRSISLPGTNQKSPILRLLLRLIPQHLMREVVYLYCIPVLPLYRIPLLKLSHRTTCWYLPKEVTLLSVCPPSSLLYGRHRALKPLASAMYWLGISFFPFL